MSKKIFIVIIVIILVIITGYFTTKRLQKNEIVEKEEKMENIKIESKVPKQWQDNGIFSKYYEKAYEKLQTLSLEEKIGQLFLICYPSNNSIEALKEYHFSGYLFFEKDFKNKEFNPFFVGYNYQNKDKFFEERGKELEFLLKSSYNSVRNAYKNIELKFNEGAITNILWYGILMRTEDILGRKENCKKIRI